MFHYTRLPAAVFVNKAATYSQPGDIYQRIFIIILLLCREKNMVTLKLF